MRFYIKKRKSEAIQQIINNQSSIINQQSGILMIRLLFLAIILCFSFSCVSIKKPHDIQNRFDPFSSMLEFYQGPLNHLSAVRHSGCPMYPSCSEYSRECIQKHGTLIGWIMTCDRLMRCGRDEIAESSLIVVNGKWRYHDSVEKNDGWWRTP